MSTCSIKNRQIDLFTAKKLYNLTISAGFRRPPPSKAGRRDREQDVALLVPVVLPAVEALGRDQDAVALLQLVGDVVDVDGDPPLDHIGDLLAVVHRLDVVGIVLPRHVHHAELDVPADVGGQQLIDDVLRLRPAERDPRVPADHQVPVLLLAEEKLVHRNVQRHGNELERVDRRVHQVPFNLA